MLRLSLSFCSVTNCYYSCFCFCFCTLTVSFNSLFLRSTPCNETRYRIWRLSLYFLFIHFFGTIFLLRRRRRRYCKLIIVIIFVFVLVLILCTVFDALHWNRYLRPPLYFLFIIFFFGTTARHRHQRNRSSWCNWRRTCTLSTRFHIRFCNFEFDSIRGFIKVEYVALVT